ncbi:CbtB-domain containing protein [Pseudosulfitobacter sp. SM2401]|jgi:cobalt transporter subunit CbtB|uniref:CbtB domain-containing protein n=1 Tax=Pseudosulfitobacter sp. SM2401 TaxID=3350098 RepID=UPI0036F211C5
MNTNVKAIAAPQTSARSNLLTAAFAVLMGVGIIFVTGHVQAAALHDAAHDVRHATGFPCH